MKDTRGPSSSSSLSPTMEDSDIAEAPFWTLSHNRKHVESNIIGEVQDEVKMEEGFSSWSRGSNITSSINNDGEKSHGQKPKSHYLHCEKLNLFGHTTKPSDETSSSSKGFVPYKRCINAAEEREGQRIRLSLQFLP